MMLLDVLAVAAAKVASASTVAQIATGLGITVAGVTGAGAAGVLPGPVQDGVAGAIEAGTPFDAPDSGDTTAGPAHRAPEEEPPSPSPSPSATTAPVLPTTAAPTSTEASEHVEVEVEPGDDDGVHQHRGGREETVPAVPTDAVRPTSGRDHAEDDGLAAPPSVDAPEVEDHGGHSGGGSGGGHSGGGSGGGDSSGSGGGDSSGHGGGDD